MPAAPEPFLRVLAIAAQGALNRFPKADPLRVEKASAELPISRREGDRWAVTGVSVPRIAAIPSLDGGFLLALKIFGRSKMWSTKDGLSWGSTLRPGDLTLEEVEKEVALFFTAPFAVARVSDEAIAMAGGIWERGAGRAKGRAR